MKRKKNTCFAHAYIDHRVDLRKSMEQFVSERYGQPKPHLLFCHKQLLCIRNIEVIYRMNRYISRYHLSRYPSQEPDGIELEPMRSDVRDSQRELQTFVHHQ